MARSQRPKGITIMARLGIVNGIISLFTASLLFSSPSHALLAYWIAILGVLNFIFAFGAFALKPWAWGYGVTLQIINIISGIYYGLFTTSHSSIIGIVLPCWFLYYLYRPNVRRVFGKG